MGQKKAAQRDRRFFRNRHEAGSDSLRRAPHQSASRLAGYNFTGRRLFRRIGLFQFFSKVCDLAMHRIGRSLLNRGLPNRLLLGYGLFRRSFFATVFFLPISLKKFSSQPFSWQRACGLVSSWQWPFSPAPSSRPVGGLPRHAPSISPWQQVFSIRQFW